MSDRFYLRKIQRNRQNRFMIADHDSGDFSVFTNESTAKAALRELNEGKARFCPDCGRWVLYRGGVDGHGELGCQAMQVGAEFEQGEDE